MNIKKIAAVALPLLLLAACLLLGWQLLPDMGKMYGAERVLITEVCARNLTGRQDAEGNHSDWIELTNETDADVDLTGWYLSDSKKHLTRYAFPAGTVLPAHGIMTVWADRLDYADELDGLHLNFALSAGEETLYLSNPEGDIVDTLAFPKQRWDVTFGRRQGHADETGWFATATPGAINPNHFLEQWKSPTLETTVEYSVPAGRYDADFSLSLTTTDPDSVIVYTTDGSDPAKSGHAYTGVISIRNLAGEKNRYVSQNCIDDISPLWVSYGSNEVEKCTVVKARTKKDGDWGPLCTASYWVGTTAHTLPVVSVSAAAEELFGNNGIYTAGATYYTAKKYNIETDTPVGNNLSEKEIAASVEIFETDGHRTLADTATIHVAGESSRMYELQKSISVELENGSYTLTVGGKEYELSDFTLRGPGCGSTYYASYQDGFFSNYLNDYSDVELGAQHNQPIVLYLEGEYWGIYMLREKKNAQLYENHFGVDGNHVITLDTETTPAAAAQSAPMRAHIDALDWNDPEELAWVEETFDMDNIISFVVCNLFTNNFDGALVANHNVILWKTDYTNDENPYADGRWRAISSDLDVTFVDPENRGTPEQNRLANLIEEDADYNADSMIPKRLCHKLWGNDAFRLRFVRACVEAVQTTYSADTLLPALQEWRAVLAPEQPQNLARLETVATDWAPLHRWLYHEEPPTLTVTPEGWSDIMDGMETYAANRGEALMNDLWTYCAPEMEQLRAEGVL